MYRAIGVDYPVGGARRDSGSATLDGTYLVARPAADAALGIDKRIAKALAIASEGDTPHRAGGGASLTPRAVALLVDYYHCFCLLFVVNQ